MSMQLCDSKISGIATSSRGYPSQSRWGKGTSGMLHAPPHLHRPHTARTDLRRARGRGLRSKKRWIQTHRRIHVQLTAVKEGTQLEFWGRLTLPSSLKSGRDYHSVNLESFAIINQAFIMQCSTDYSEVCNLSSVVVDCICCRLYPVRCYLLADCVHSDYCRIHESCPFSYPMKWRLNPPRPDVLVRTSTERR